MAKIILSDAAPTEDGPITFGFGQHESFVPPFETNSAELVNLANEHEWLEVQGTIEPEAADEPVQVEASTPSAAPATERPFSFNADIKETK